MTMKSSVFSVVGTFPTADGGSRRGTVQSFDTRSEAQECADWQQAEQIVEGSSFEVMLLDRRPEPEPEARTDEEILDEKRAQLIESGQPAGDPFWETDHAGLMAQVEEDRVRRMLKAALKRFPLPSEVRRALACWEG